MRGRFVQAFPAGWGCRSSPSGGSKPSSRRIAHNCSALISRSAKRSAASMAGSILGFRVSTRSSAERQQAQANNRSLGSLILPDKKSSITKELLHASHSASVMGHLYHRRSYHSAAPGSVENRPAATGGRLGKLNRSPGAGAR